MPNPPLRKGLKSRLCTGGFIYIGLYKDAATETAPNHVGIHDGMMRGKRRESSVFRDGRMGCKPKQGSGKK